jgi:uncharacterized protein (TIGR00375 family)
MQQILDLHIHSRYSRACSPQLTLANIAATCLTKGIDIVATGDFTHPAWFTALNQELVETSPGAGLYRLKDGSSATVKFILSTEASLVYKDQDKVRRLHLVIHAPNLEAVAELNRQLGQRFNIRSDGRPILGISAPDLVKLILQIDPNFLIYPAHIWTPWYSVFGSKSGFDSLEACFHEQVDHIYAIETGLSSDPAMNWRLSALDQLTILSSSDAHSLHNIGREANIFQFKAEPTYSQIYEMIKHQTQAKLDSTGQVIEPGLLSTIEFYPEEGMYHFDGHRNCNFSCEPAVSRGYHNLCPVCHKPLIIGVLNRVEELADRPIGYRPARAVDFKKLVELDKIIAEALGIKSRESKVVQRHYQELTSRFGSELSILLDLDLEQAGTSLDSRISEGISRMRRGDLIIQPGFDGEYGQVHIFSEANRPQAQEILL